YQSGPLEKTHCRALCLICAAFKTSPTTALEIEASIPPIQHLAKLHSRCCTIRFNKLPISNAVIQRMPKTWRN
ncbi:hypothetical protein B0H34DRAFT_621319, partial [Crassisporium funariophilum]